MIIAMSIFKLTDLITTNRFFIKHRNCRILFMQPRICQLQFKGLRNFLFIPIAISLMKTLQKWKKFVWECCFLIFFFVKGETLTYMMLWKPWGFNPLTPKICLSILPSSYYTFPCKLIMRIWCSIEVINCTWWVWVFSLLVCCVVYEYFREKVHCNHLWELKG